MFTYQVIPPELRQSPYAEMAVSAFASGIWAASVRLRAMIQQGASLADLEEALRTWLLQTVHYAELEEAKDQAGK
jgi:hypothetical protein